MKSVNVYVSEGLKGSFTTRYSFGGDYSKESVLASADTIKARAKKDYPNAEFVDVLVPVAPKIDKETLMEIGQEVASGWGAVCTGVKTYPESVMFECNEFGEKFTTHLSYDYIREEYKDMLN